MVQVALVTTEPVQHLRLSHLLRNARKDRGHTQAEAGRILLDVSQQTIGSWENGKEAPSWSFAQPVADYISMSLADTLVLMHSAHLGLDVDPFTLTRVDRLEQKVNLLLEQAESNAKPVASRQPRRGRTA